MGWIKITGKVLEYTGQIAQTDGFEEWAKDKGKGLVDIIIKEKGYSVFKNSRAKKELWKDLENTIDSKTLQAALDAEAKSFTQIPGWISEKARGLVKSNTYPSVFIVPRYLVQIIAYNDIEKNLEDSDELSRLKGGDLLKKFFFKEFIRKLDENLMKMKISPKKAISSYDKTYIVGTDKETIWDDDLLPGHYYVSDSGYSEYSKSQINTIEKGINNVMVRAGKFSHQDKDDIVNNIELK